MAGFLWFLTGSWVVAGAVLFGLFVHEYGHVLAMNRVGMGPARIYIIPFLGGLAKGQRAPNSEWHGVLVSLAGPAFGLLAMIPFVAVGLALKAPEWLMGAFFIAMINLLNLLPAPPLDGSKALGPVLTRVHPRLEQVALLVVGGLAVWWGAVDGAADPRRLSGSGGVRPSEARRLARGVGAVELARGGTQSGPLSADGRGLRGGGDRRPAAADGRGGRTGLRDGAAVLRRGRPLGEWRASGTTGL